MPIKNTTKNAENAKNAENVENVENVENNKETISFNFITPETVMELIKDNKEMKQIILEQNTTISNLVKNGVNAHNNTNSLNNNKTFNLQFFLHP